MIWLNKGGWMRKPITKLLWAAALVTGLAACSSEEDTVIMAPLPVVQSEFTPATNWTSTVRGGVGHFFSELSPVYAYDTLFVASRDGLVRALEPETGKEIWSQNLQQDTPARLSGGIHAAYRQLFIGSENGELISLDVESGEIKWRAPVQGEVLSESATDSNLVLTHTSRGILVAHKEETGEEVWSISTEVPALTLRGTSSPVTASGGVFWGTANGRLAAAIIDSGQLIWQQPIATPKGATEIDRLVDVDASPLIMGTNLYTVGFNGQLVAIDLRSGSPAWKRNYSSAMDITSDGRTLYLITDRDHVVAVDARSGTELWSNVQLENRLLTAPKLIDDMVVVGDSEGYLHWLDRRSGNFVAQQLVDESGFAVGPVELDDGFVIQTRRGSVIKYSLNDE
jgi:outer membrane protein assembly factor BamB